jgi:hypothetical protein
VLFRSGRARVLLADVDEICRAISAHSRARRAHLTRNSYRTVAKPTADVQYARTLWKQASRHHGVAVIGEPVDQQMLETQEFLEQHGVPGLDDHVVVAHRTRLP